MTDDIALLIPAGGRSTRMGRDKAALPLAGRTMSEHMLDKGRALGLSPLLVCGDRPVPPDAIAVRDRLPDRGPLGALLSGLRTSGGRACLVLAVDLPLVPLSLLSELLAQHALSGARITLVRHGGRVEPLIGVYTADVADAIEPLIRERGAPMRALWEQIPPRYLDTDLPETCFLNCNTLAELRMAELLLQNGADS